VRLAGIGGLRVLVFDLLEQAGVACALSTVPLDVRAEPDRTRFARALGAERLATARQVHHAEVRVADPDRVPDADGLVTDQPGLALLLRAADCSLVVVADPEHRALGLAHAGWKGSARGVVVRLVAAMRSKYKTRPEHCLAGVGPTIGPTRFEVGPEVPAAFYAKRSWTKEYVKPSGAKFLFDLPGVNARFLVEAGIPEHAIEKSGLCTYDSPGLLHSFRRDKTGAGHQGMLACWPATSSS